MKSIVIKATIITLFLLFSHTLFSQVQVVKGQVKDLQGGYPLIGATVLLIGSDPVLGGVTDVDGNFEIREVPIGRQNFAVHYIGYKGITLPNVLVTAGKQVVLSIKLEESVEQLQEIIITTDADKDLPINDLAKVSARTFSLEEVNRFSGGRNDVARLAASFAGVSAPNDARNDIVVRGNSPVGLLWRVEGIPLATTNHFATLGTTGGPVNALNTNLLRTSDFLTGAFPAEYGNANAAVFDVNFRNGNTDEYEFTGQMSVSGLEFLVEGPIRRANNSSFVASYRYGIASIAATGTTAIPFYQDFSFKVNLGQSKIGRFEFFGLGGLSNITFKGEEVDEDDLFANPNQDAFVDNDLGLFGMSHTLGIGKSGYLRSTLGVSTTFNDYRQDNLIRDPNNAVIGKYRATNVSNRENRYTYSSTLNQKMSTRFSFRTGVLLEIYDINFFTKDRDNRKGEIEDANNDMIPDRFIVVRNIRDNYALTQGFAQGEYKFSDDFNATLGFHSQYHSFTSKTSFEPRFGLSWQVDNIQRLSFAYGLHAQSIPSPILFLEEEIAPETYERTNAELGFMQSHHLVTGYDRNIGTDWRLKAEVYYQSLFDIPVETTPGVYSVLNQGSDFVFEGKGSLVNEGTGTNYGIELTLEKFFSKGYYTLFTTSLFESKYKDSDGVERNTANDSNFIVNFLAGKEWKFGPNGRNAWTFDTKLTTSGGNPFTPIDVVATRNNGGREVRMNNLAFSERYDDYFRWDVKLGVRLNSAKKKVSHQFFVDLQNLTNRTNEFVRRYNEVTNEVNSVKQIGIFPDVLYRIQF